MSGEKMDCCMDKQGFEFEGPSIAGSSLACLTNSVVYLLSEYWKKKDNNNNDADIYLVNNK